MRTTKVISTISYNTVDFLKNVLENEIACDYYFFISHKAEDDETKPHIHLTFKPSNIIDTVSIRKKFNEPCEKDIPLGVMPFTTCNNLEECILYYLHDSVYLQSKGLVRKYHYKITDVVSSDFDFIHNLYNDIDMSKFGLIGVMYKYASVGAPFCDLVANGYIPLGKINLCRSYYEELLLYHNKLVSYLPNSSDDNKAEQLSFINFQDFL